MLTRPLSLAFRWGALQHGLRNTAQDVDFLLTQLSAVEQLLQARHQFFGSRRVQKTDRGQSLLPVPQHARHLLGIGLVGRGSGGKLNRKSECQENPINKSNFGENKLEFPNKVNSVVILGVTLVLVLPVVLSALWE